VRKANNDIKDADKYEYYNLCACVLRNIIHNYKQYVNWLIYAEIIEVDRSWTKDTKCIGYRFKRKYLKGLIAPSQEIIYDSKLHNKLEPFRCNKDVKEKYTHLIKWFDSLEVDHEKAEMIIEDKLKDDDKKQYHYTRLANIAYNKDSLSYSIGSTGRFYNPICTLHKSLRQSLTVNGSYLVETDIKSSIPFISTCLFDRNFLLKQSDILSNLDIKLLPKDTTNIDTHIMLSKKGIVVRVDSMNPDVLEYVNDVRNGDIYIKLMELWNKELDSSYTRNRAKKKLLQTLNSPSYIKSKEKALVASKYPSVIEFIDDINGCFTLNQYKTKNEEDFAPFAYITQMIESRFVLDICCKRIAEEYPHVPIYTIHDSIWTTADYSELVLNIMKEESISYFGVGPTLR